MIRHRRDHAVGISAEALALAWARTERAPDGATIVIGQEISPRGFNGRLWTIEPEHTVALAVVLRPELASELADGVWLAAGLAAADAITDVGGEAVEAAWPDRVVARTGAAEVAMIKTHVQLGPAGVRSAVVTIRVDLLSAGLAMSVRADLADALHARVVERSIALGTDPEAIAMHYGARCMLTGRRVKIDLRPSGETRGVVRAFESGGALLLGASQDIHDRVSIDALRDIHVVE